MTAPAIQAGHSPARDREYDRQARESLTLLAAGFDRRLAAETQWRDAEIARLTAEVERLLAACPQDGEGLGERGA